MVIFMDKSPMFVALMRRISDISISPAGGEPTATPHGARRGNGAITTPVMAYRGDASHTRTHVYTRGLLHPA